MDTSSGITTHGGIPKGGGRTIDSEYLIECTNQNGIHIDLSHSIGSIHHEDYVMQSPVWRSHRLPGLCCQLIVRHAVTSDTQIS
ncbi:hypothetical protein Rhal01_03783 [Rubritalea halochordaticola]|uniref:Uncharacterized protein n=1 Tax=Rubritalea halochordaticola TaxID=714537 RepID=A0ABP9VAD8_9BACT